MFLNPALGIARPIKWGGQKGGIKWTDGCGKGSTSLPSSLRVWSLGRGRPVRNSKQVSRRPLCKQGREAASFIHDRPSLPSQTDAIGINLMNIFRQKQNGHVYRTLQSDDNADHRSVVTSQSSVQLRGLRWIVVYPCVCFPVIVHTGLNRHRRWSVEQPA